MSACLAYLDDWKKDWKGDCFAYEYHFWVHQYFDPARATSVRSLPKMIESFRPFVEAFLIQPKRAGTVSYQLLLLHLTTLGYYGRFVEAKAIEHDDEAKAIVTEMMGFLGQQEVYFETCYDQYMFMHAMERIVGKL